MIAGGGGKRQIVDYLGMYLFFLPSIPVKFYKLNVSACGYVLLVKRNNGNNKNHRLENIIMINLARILTANRPAGSHVPLL